MRLFKDAQGREWELVLDPYQIGQVKSILSENLYKLIDDNGAPLGELLTDPARLIDIIYVLCREQCKARQLSDVDFGRSFNGDAFEEAKEAFVQELIDFFPKAARDSLRRLTEQGRKLGDILLRKANEQMDGLDLEATAERLFEQLKAKKSSDSSGNTEASLASTQAT